MLRSNKPQSLDQRAKRADARAAFRGSFDRGGATGANSFAARSREADKGIRTLDIQLGKLTLYQLSYARVRLECSVSRGECGEQRTGSRAVSSVLAVKSPHLSRFFLGARVKRSSRLFWPSPTSLRLDSRPRKLPSRVVRFLRRRPRAFALDSAAFEAFVAQWI